MTLYSRLYSLSTRAQLFLIVLILALPAAGIILYSGVKLRQAAVDKTRMQTRKLADRIADEQQDLITETRQLMVSLALLSELRSHDAATVQPVLKDVLKLNPRYSSIFVADPDGSVWVSAVPAQSPLSIADRRYFREAMATGRLASGEYVVGRASGVPTFHLGYPLKTRTGATAGVLCVGLVFQQYRGLAKDPDLPAGTGYLLLDHRGVALDRATNAEEFIGKTLDPALFQVMRDGPESFTGVGLTMAGDTRVYSYRKLRIDGETEPYMYVRAGIPLDVVQSTANRSLAGNLLLFASFFLLSLYIASRIGKRSIVDRIAALEAASERLAAGDLQVRVSDLVDGGELGRLGRTFDRMARELASRQQALLASESNYREIFNATADGIFVHQAETGKVLEVNRSVEEMFGYSRQEMLSLPMHETRNTEPPYSAADALARIHKAVSEGPQSFEWLSRRKNGERFWTEVVLSATGIGREGRVMAVVRDISERKRAEQERSAIASLLQESQGVMDLESLLGAALDILLSIPWLSQDSRGAVFLADESGDALLLKAHRNLESRRKAECAVVPFGRCLCGRVAASRRPESADAADHRRDVPGDGEEPHGHYCMPISHSGRLLGVLNLSRREGHRWRKRDEEFLAAYADAMAGIIQRMRAEAEHRKLVSLVEMSRDFVGILTVAGGVSYLNNAALDLVGLGSLEAAHGRTFFDFFPPSHLPQARETLFPALRTDGFWQEETRLRHFASGAAIDVELTAFLVRDAHGQPICIAATARDVTERKRAEEETRKLQSQLLHSQKMESIGQLAGGIAHDFNNILTAIIGYGAVLHMKMPTDDPNRTYVDQVLAGAEKAASLTQSLLAFSRKQVINPRPLDLNEAIRRLLKFLSRILGEDIELKTTLFPERLTIVADATQVEQVLMNLATNARDAMPDGGRFLIESGRVEFKERYILSHGYAKPGTYAVLSVSDTGTGMDENIQEKIFEPFFTTKGVGRGTGLGLPIVYGVVKQHGGYISVYSEVGKGTTFRIYLRLARSETVGMEAAEMPDQPVGGDETILLAEDNPEVRQLTSRVLKEYGYNVIEATDGEDALNKFRENQDRVQMLLTDVIMPRRSGREVFDAARAIRPDLRTLFTSGYPADYIQKRGMLEEGLHFLSKPATPQMLLRKIREILDGKGGTP
jgi:PAS domain S-box-containing protein